MGIRRKGEILRETRSNGPNRSQFLLSSKNLVPLVNSVPTTNNGTAKNKKPKTKVLKPGKCEEQIAVSLLKAPLVSTRGQEELQSQLQDLNSDGTASLNVDKNQSKLRGWQYLRYCRERLKMEAQEDTELPFPYTMHAWKVHPHSSLLSISSLTLPNVNITSWNSVQGISTDTVQSKNEEVDKKEVDDASNSTIHQCSLVSMQDSEDLKSVLIQLTPKETTSLLSIKTVTSTAQDTSVEEKINYSKEYIVNSESRADQCESIIKKPMSQAGYSCDKKYSWQSLDRNVQTSWTLLQNLTNLKFEREENENADLVFKYSWQIIGTETQTCAEDYEGKDGDCNLELRSSKFYDNKDTQLPKQRSYKSSRSSRIRKIVNSEYTQTCANKENQTNFTDIYAAYRSIYPNIYG